jgi:hypothetical protein
MIEYLNLIGVMLMKKSMMLLIGCLVILLIVSCPVAAYFVESGSNTDNGNKPTILVEYGKGKDIGLVKVTHIHYAKSEAKGKPPKTDTCYSLAGWKWSSPVTYIVTEKSSYPLLYDAMVSADSEWDSHTNGVLFNTPVIGPGIWGVQDYKNSVSYGNYNTDGVIAVTVTWYNRFTKNAVESDILFDTDFTWGDATKNANFMDLQNIATHEIGHTLGLSDLYTTSCSPVTMYGYSWNGDTTKRTLESPDITGLQKLYG